MNTERESFNSDSRILIVCDHVVLFYDFMLDTVVSVAASHTKKSPTCATFLCLNMVAMGFADGLIRIWNMYNDGLGRRRKPIKTLASHGGVPIALLKVLPMSTETEGGYRGGPSPGARCVRLVSVGGDGSALIWDLPLSSHGELDVSLLGSLSTPNARLEESIGVISRGTAGSGSGPSALVLLDVFADEETQTLVTVTGDRVVRLWDLTVLSHAYNIRGQGGDSSILHNYKTTTHREEREDEQQEGEDGGSDEYEYDEGESVGGSSFDSFAISSRAESVAPSQQGQGLGSQRHGGGVSVGVNSPSSMSVSTVRHVHEATARPVCVVHAHGVSKAVNTPMGGQGQVGNGMLLSYPDIRLTFSSKSLHLATPFVYIKIPTLSPHHVTTPY